ncbi:hypothetical protein BDW22DRAFT_1410907 [Trametopsis cervina]|nr:hypothetical protein BDW22DRAFT_1410907 [Trametopsis cervina]
MVFSNLSSSEKDAFFGLLDEYFASRPDVFGNATDSDNGKAALSALRGSFANQSETSNESSVPAWKRQREASTSSPQPESDHVPVGRVAAAAAALKWNPAGPGAPPPRPPPRRISSDQSEESGASSPPPSVSSSTNKLVTQKKFGDVDISSGKNAFLSIRNGTANKTATPPPVAPPVPPAFATPKRNFAPPPVRRVSSITPEPVKATPPPPPPRAAPEPEETGEWAEALYEYTSEDPGDLPLQEGQQVYVVEKTSDDWWTAVSDGRRGLVPASYVKIL